MAKYTLKLRRIEDAFGKRMGDQLVVSSFVIYAIP